MKPKSNAFSPLRWLLIGITIGGICLILGLFFFRNSLADWALTFVEKKLSERDLHVSFEDPKISGLSKMSLGNVQVFTSNDRNRRLLSLHSVKLLRESSQRLVLENGEGRLGDIDLHVSGVLVIPKNEHPSDPTPTEKQASSSGTKNPQKREPATDLTSLLQKWEQHLRSGNDGPRPQLEIRFLVEDSLNADFALTGEDLNWQGIPISSLYLTGSYHEARKQIEKIDLQWKNEAGTPICHLTGALHLQTHHLAVDHFECSLEVLTAIQASPWKPSGAAANIVFTDPPVVKGQGVIDLKDILNSDTTMQLRSRNPVDLDETLRIDRLDVEARLSGRNLTLSNLYVASEGGRLAGTDIAITFPGDTIRLEDGHFLVKRLPLEAVAKWTQADFSLSGLLDAEIDFTGGKAVSVPSGFDPASLNGTGSLKIKEGNFYELPVLGPVYVILDELTRKGLLKLIFPRKEGERPPQKANGTFLMKNGILHLKKQENLEIISNLTKLSAKGEIDFQNATVDLEMEAGLRKLPKKKIYVSGPWDDVDTRLTR